MNWFRITMDSGDDGCTFGGSTTDSLEILGEKATRNQYIRLENLFYNDRGEIKEWAEWDNREIPTVLIKPARIVAIVQYKADPRTLSRSA